MIICGADNPLRNEGDLEGESGYFTHKKKLNAFVQAATTVPIPSCLLVPWQLRAGRVWGTGTKPEGPLQIWVYFSFL